jgi:hypothetical protein
MEPKRISKSLPKWDEKSAVRSLPRRTLEQGGEHRLYFPPELAPVLGHPLLQSLSQEQTNEILVHHLYRYLDFTEVLELRVVNVVASEIALSKMGLALPDIMQEEAFDLVTDESYHAKMSNDVKRQVSKKSNFPLLDFGTPNFLRRLRTVQSNLPTNLVPLSEMLFTVVSETLISSTLNEIPRDERLDSGIREMVADHARDELCHKAYFSKFFRHIWPRLTPTEKSIAGQFLPGFIVAFIEPDVAAIRTGMERFSFSRDDLDLLMAETYPEQGCNCAIRQAAQCTLRLFESEGVFDDRRTADQFRTVGLID